ncbi:hypothetical protein JL720_4674 [Aureococcus anophagefferens]|nr:hypothetical protein JL720_4674 [Aureococcus anophagefferens]
MLSDSAQWRAVREQWIIALLMLSAEAWRRPSRRPADAGDACAPPSQLSSALMDRAWAAAVAKLALAEVDDCEPSLLADALRHLVVAGGLAGEVRGAEAAGRRRAPPAAPAGGAGAAAAGGAVAARLRAAPPDVVRAIRAFASRRASEPLPRASGASEAAARPHLGAHPAPGSERRGRCRHRHALWVALKRDTRPRRSRSWTTGRAADAAPEPEGAAPPELLETAAAWRGDAAERTPLHDAAKMADGGDALRVCGALLRRGAAVDVAEVDDVRPLHEACAAGHAAVVGLLLRHGADPSAPAAQWRWCDERSVDAPFRAGQE